MWTCIVCIASQQHLTVLWGNCKVRLLMLASRLCRPLCSRTASSSQSCTTGTSYVVRTSCAISPVVIWVKHLSMLAVSVYQAALL